MLSILIPFFFSIRRPHTRLTCDWGSDVCSSDLLRASHRQFGVIIGDLFVPWRRGEAAMLSRDHFEVVKRALAPGGIFCQWIPMFQLSEDEFNKIGRAHV